MQNKIIEAIQLINPNAEVSVSGEDINSIVWENVNTPIPIEDIESKILEITTKEEKATAKAKLVAGEPLTEAEADPLIL